MYLKKEMYISFLTSFDIMCKCLRNMKLVRNYEYLFYLIKTRLLHNGIVKHHVAL